jgi:hypothetical protein
MLPIILGRDLVIGGIRVMIDKQPINKGAYLRACANRRVAYVSTGAAKVVGSPRELLALGWHFSTGADS